MPKMSREEELRRELIRAADLSQEEIATKVRAVGFRCLGCGECCRGPECEVVLFPSEVERIMDYTGEPWLEAAEPPRMGEWDDLGNFHTLEWRIRKEEDCHYYNGIGCSIYSRRPIMCRTYPFYLAERDLKFSECRGLGQAIGEEEALMIAGSLIERYIMEIEEALELISKFRDFRRGNASKDGHMTVHDSRGEHIIRWAELPGVLNILLGDEPSQ